MTTNNYQPRTIEQLLVLLNAQATASNPHWRLYRQAFNVIATHAENNRAGFSFTSPCTVLTDNNYQVLCLLKGISPTTTELVKELMPVENKPLTRESTLQQLGHAMAATNNHRYHRAGRAMLAATRETGCLNGIGDTTYHTAADLINDPDNARLTLRQTHNIGIFGEQQIQQFMSEQGLQLHITRHISK